MGYESGYCSWCGHYNSGKHCECMNCGERWLPFLQDAEIMSAIWTVDGARIGGPLRRCCAVWHVYEVGTPGPETPTRSL
eukprot:4191107-Pyramimonas_sp.AAC.1